MPLLIHPDLAHAQGNPVSFTYKGTVYSIHGIPEGKDIFLSFLAVLLPLTGLHIMHFEDGAKINQAPIT
eukprot:snap_masked-scaffold_12-processed-gene-11.53-mRNA-1 protein AED:1.00 eAED:1.00 QI:0/-1/0/0/-1/1/1/0/68